MPYSLLKQHCNSCTILIVVYKVLYCVGNLYISFRRELELLQEGKVAKALTYELWVQLLVTGSFFFFLLFYIQPNIKQSILCSCNCRVSLRLFSGTRSSITARQRLRKENVVDCCVKFTKLYELRCH